MLHNQGVDDAVVKYLGLKKNDGHTNITALEKSISSFKNPSYEVNIAICGKYNSLQDAYKSILEAFIHYGIENKTSVNVRRKIEKFTYNEEPTMSISHFRIIFSIMNLSTVV